MNEAEAKREASEIAPLWPGVATAHWDAYARFMARQAFERNWTTLDAFLVDHYFQEALTAFHDAEDAALEAAFGEAKPLLGRTP